MYDSLCRISALLEVLTHNQSAPTASPPLATPESINKKNDFIGMVKSIWRDFLCLVTGQVWTWFRKYTFSYFLVCKFLYRMIRI